MKFTETAIEVGSKFYTRMITESLLLSYNFNEPSGSNFHIREIYYSISKPDILVTPIFLVTPIDQAKIVCSNGEMLRKRFNAVARCSYLG